jgi:NADH-quinone oxidoreductase subunit D
MGPQHPSTHGVFRMDVTLDGEKVVKLKPVFGYLHRNHEKIAENETYLGSMPYTDRLDYICSITNNWAYALAVEKLAGIQVPERAEYLRVITGELTRLQNHAGLVGFLMQDMGASGTPLMYAFREREKILDLFEALTGARMMFNYMRFGGCRVDVPAGWLQQAQKVIDGFPRFLDEFERLLVSNEILMARTQGVGVVTREQAINAGISGPIRVLEMRESIEILKQAMRDLPSGPIMDPNTKIRGFRPKAGEAYGRIEGPKGELGFYLISDGTAIPYRYRVRPPSLINLTLLEDMCLGQNVADIVIILGSIDIVLGEVDR